MAQAMESDSGEVEVYREPEGGWDSSDEESEIQDDESMQGGEVMGSVDMGCINNITDDVQVRKHLRYMEKRRNEYTNKKTWKDDVEKMHKALTKEGIGSPVMEIYSPVRVNGIAAKLGILPGLSLDLTTNDPDDGKPWDFSVKAKRDKAMDKVLSKEALLIIGSPLCTSFSQLQNWNYQNMKPEKRDKMMREGKQHLEFCMLLYQLQHENGMYFLHEHPYTATSWKNAKVQELLNTEGIECVQGHMCCFGMFQETSEGTQLVKKPTGFMSNAKGIREELGKKCNGEHSHVSLLNGRAKRAQVYPDELCYRILKGLIDQMKLDGRIQQDGIGLVMPEEEKAWDDVSGDPLEFKKVIEARTEELQEFSKHGVYIYATIEECWEKTGKAPIKTKWIDINKGDRIHEEYRSRLVAKDFNTDKRPDLFAATPPLEALKYLLSLWMTEGYGWKKGKSEEMKMDFIDVRRAYFHAVTTRDVYVELPPEDKKPGMCGKLMKSMYGTRDAAQNWEQAYTEFMEKAGFVRGIASPCVFWNEEKQIRAVIHGDD
ncbi:MAG: hypothetical protein NLN65_07530, partial [Candidatus Poseidoniaceae archaeon]|nr:hypothetical protein [Candidatus Poseidoniaceae archaeon]